MNERLKEEKARSKHSRSVELRRRPGTGTSHQCWRPKHARQRCDATPLNWLWISLPVVCRVHFFFFFLFFLFFLFSFFLFLFQTPLTCFSRPRPASLQPNFNRSYVHAMQTSKDRRRRKAKERERAREREERTEREREREREGGETGRIEISCPQFFPSPAGSGGRG